MQLSNDLHAGTLIKEIVLVDVFFLSLTLMVAFRSITCYTVHKKGNNYPRMENQYQSTISLGHYQ